MKSDVIQIDNKGNGMEAALNEAESVARFRGLNEKETMRLRMLTEEMLGLVRSVTGELAATFWIDSEDKAFALHLSTKTEMDASKRYQLISSSTEGKNEAAKGFVGFLRDKLETALMAEDDGVLYDFNGIPQSEAAADNEWDRYERSILRKLADQIKIAVRGGKVEMDVLKKF